MCDLGDVHRDNQYASVPGIHLIHAPAAGKPMIFAAGSMVDIAQPLIETELEGYGLASVTQIKPFDQSTFLQH